MAKRLENFSFSAQQQQGRYDWANWTDGSAWEIRQGADYTVPTENMRVNLFMKAKQKGRKVRTQIVRDDEGEGLRFQFYEPGGETNSGAESAPVDNAGGEEAQPHGDSLEDRWHAEMVGVHEDAKSAGYNASRFIQMVNEQGGLVAAKALINSTQPSDGFTKLWELGRLDITVEARALKLEFRELFSPLEVKKCRERLASYEWSAEPPWAPPTVD